MPRAKTARIRPARFPNPVPNPGHLTTCPLLQSSCTGCKGSYSRATKGYRDVCFCYIPNSVIVSLKPASVSRPIIISERAPKKAPMSSKTCAWLLAKCSSIYFCTARASTTHKLPVQFNLGYGYYWDTGTINVDEFHVAGFPSDCWDPLQTLGVQGEQSESFLYYRAEQSPGCASGKAH